MPQRGSKPVTIDAQSVTKAVAVKSDQSTYGYTQYKNTAGSTSHDIVTKTTIFSAGATVMAGFGGALWAAIQNSAKARLFMGGVQMAETAYVGWEGSTYFNAELLGYKVLTGSQIVKVTLHNYNVAANDLGWFAHGSTTATQYPYLIIGAVA